MVVNLFIESMILLVYIFGSLKVTSEHTQLMAIGLVSFSSCRRFFFSFLENPCLLKTLIFLFFIPFSAQFPPPKRFPSFSHFSISFLFLHFLILFFLFSFFFIDFRINSHFNQSIAAKKTVKKRRDVREDG